MDQFFSFFSFSKPPMMWYFYYQHFFTFEKEHVKEPWGRSRAEGTWDLAPAGLFQDVSMAILCATPFRKRQCHLTQICQGPSARGGLLSEQRFPDSWSRPFFTWGKLARGGLSPSQGPLGLLCGCPLLPETACFENRGPLTSKSHRASNLPGLPFSWAFIWCTPWGRLGLESTKSLKWAGPELALSPKLPTTCCPWGLLKWHMTEQRRAHLIHARGSEEDANLLSEFLQLPVLGVAEFQVAFVLPVGLPPGVLWSVRPLQGFPIKLILQLTLLELGAISPTLLQHTLGFFSMTCHALSERREMLGQLLSNHYL